MIIAIEHGYPQSFTFDDIVADEGPDAPGGVDDAVMVMERAFPLLSPEAHLEWRQIALRTPFDGPCLGDAFKLVTRAAAEKR